MDERESSFENQEFGSPSNQRADSVENTAPYGVGSKMSCAKPVEGDADSYRTKRR